MTGVFGDVRLSQLVVGSPSGRYWTVTVTVQNIGKQSLNNIRYLRTINAAPEFAYVSVPFCARSLLRCSGCCVTVVKFFFVLVVSLSRFLHFFVIATNMRSPDSVFCSWTGQSVTQNYVRSQISASSLPANRSASVDLPRPAAIVVSEVLL
jgi:hypothetical protein